MDKLNSYVCPKSKTPLQLKATKEKGGQVIEGELLSKDGLKFVIHKGVPDLTYPQEFHKDDLESKVWYDANAAVYDEYLPLTFSTFGVDENTERKKMVDLLNLRPNDKVLETGCGTGRDSVLIAEQLGPEGELHLQDISLNILELSFQKMRSGRAKVSFNVSNAVNLPYPDKYFDAYYHFGGFNTFSDKKLAFAEISRVVKPGGRVIVGDECMPPWLRESEFGRVLMNSNPHYKYQLPLEFMHHTARDVKIEFIIGGVFYFISYTVGEGYPRADLDFEIPGARGGTHRTRYYGHLEGISQDTIDLAKQARKVSGKSMHKWLDDAVKAAAERDLQNL